MRLKYYFFTFIVLILLGCNNERIIQLPEIESAEITEVLDVSPAYIFYDETQPDSTFFNRKNLISTTNWLVNVDKRLTLRQAIPHIQYLQNKRKKASMHKNENAKNYFTCNDTSINNLGFVEFTGINYNFENLDVETIENSIIMSVENLNNITFSLPFDLNSELSKSSIETVTTIIQKNYNKDTTLTLGLSKDLIFQDYIALKSVLLNFKNKISDEEFIF